MAHHIPGTSRPHIAVALLAVLAVIALAALTGAPRADAARTCNTDSTAYYLPKGNGYITSLRVTRVSCKTGRRLAMAYYRCRHKKGKAGRCTRKVNGYSCKERDRKRTTTPPEINARVTCKRGTRRIIHTYQQIL